jgi:ribonuclease P protein component
MLVYGLKYVYNLSAEEAETEKNPWIPSSFPNYCGPPSLKTEKDQGPPPSLSLMALPRAHRLRRRRDIERVHHGSQKRSGTFFLIKFRWKKEVPARVSVVVGKRVSKKAVRRNFLRRLTVEWIRQSGVLRRFPADIIVSVFPEADRATRRALRGELAELFQ